MTLTNTSQKLKPNSSSVSLLTERFRLLECVGDSDLPVSREAAQAIVWMALAEPVDLQQARDAEQATVIIMVERGTRKEKASVVRQLLHVLLSAIVFSTFSYFANQWQIWLLEEYPLLQGVLAALIEETLRRCESKLTS